MRNMSKKTRKLIDRKVVHKYFWFDYLEGSIFYHSNHVWPARLWIGDAKKEDFVKIMLRKIVDFVKKILWTEPMVSTVNTLKDAMRDLEVARNHFENCDPEFITAAIFELNAAESRLNAARRCAV